MTSFFGEHVAHAETLAARDALTSVPTGALCAVDGDAIYQWDGAAWNVWRAAAISGGGGSGQGLVDFAQAKRTSGNLTINSSTFANVDTGLDLTMTASAGDVIEVGLAARASGSSSYLVFDFQTIVGGVPVNSASSETTAGTGLANSYPGWGRASVSANEYFSGAKMYPLVAGDISSGTVTLRLRALSGASMTVYANDPMLYVWAKNLGPQL